MRSSITIWTIIIVLLAGVHRASAQQAVDKPGAIEHPAGGELAKKILEELSDEEREQFRMAMNHLWHAEEVEKRRQAMQEANLAYRRALQEEIRRLDASDRVRSVLQRLSRLRFSQGIKGSGGEGTGARRPERPGGKPLNLPPISNEDRSILDAARLQAEKVAAVTDARQALDQAVTMRERSLASHKYRQAMRQAMEAADPRVRRILSKRDRFPRSRGTDRGDRESQREHR